MSLISELKTNYTNKRLNIIKQLETDLYNQEDSIKSSFASSTIFSVEKKNSIESISNYVLHRKEYRI